MREGVCAWARFVGRETRLGLPVGAVERYKEPVVLEVAVLVERQLTKLRQSDHIVTRRGRALMWSWDEYRECG